MELSCQELLADLGDYLDDQASAQVRAALEAHLALCKTCTVLIDSTRKTLKIVTEHSAFELPADVAAKILAKIRTAVEEP